MEYIDPEQEYVIYTDGGSRGNPGPSGAGGVIKDSTGKIVLEVSEYIGIQTNNYAEYKALELTLQEAVLLNIRRIEIKMDSKLVVEQVKGNYKVNNENLLILHENIIDLLTNFDSFSIKHIYRYLNTHADGLANRAIDSNTNI